MLSLGSGLVPAAMALQPLHVLAPGTEGQDDCPAEVAALLAGIRGWQPGEADAEPSTMACIGKSGEGTPPLSEAQIDGVVAESPDVSWQATPATEGSSAGGTQVPVPARRRGLPMRRLDNWAFLDASTGQTVSLWAVMEQLAQPVGGTTPGVDEGGDAGDTPPSFTLHGTLVPAGERFAGLADAHTARVVLPMRNVGFPATLQTFPQASAAAPAVQTAAPAASAAEVDDGGRQEGADKEGGVKRPREEAADVPAPGPKRSRASASVKVRVEAFPGAPVREECHARAKQAVAGKSLPLSIGSHVVLQAVGSMVTHPDRVHMFHNSKYLFPVGWRLQRTFTSYKDPAKRTQYTCEIKDGGEDGPLFTITPGDDPGTEISEATAGLAWKEVGKRVREAQSAVDPNARHGSTINGAEYFGLSNSRLACFLEALPGALDCPDYVFMDQRPESQPKPAAAPASGPAATATTQTKLTGFLKTPSASETQAEQGGDAARLRQAVIAISQAAKAAGKALALPALMQAVQASHPSVDLAPHKGDIERWAGLASAAAPAPAPAVAPDTPSVAQQRMALQQVANSISPAAATAAAAQNPHLAAAAQAGAARAGIPHLAAVQLLMAQMHQQQFRALQMQGHLAAHLQAAAASNGGVLPGIWVAVATSLGMPASQLMELLSKPAQQAVVAPAQVEQAKEVAPVPPPPPPTPKERVEAVRQVLVGQASPPPTAQRLGWLNPEPWSALLPERALRTQWNAWREPDVAAAAVLAEHHAVLSGPRTPVAIPNVRALHIEFTPMCPVLWAVTDKAWYALATLSCDSLPAAPYEPSARRGLLLFTTCVAIVHAAYAQLAARMRVSSTDFFKTVARWTSRRAIALAKAQTWMLQGAPPPLPSPDTEGDTGEAGDVELTSGPPAPQAGAPVPAGSSTEQAGSAGPVAPPATPVGETPKSAPAGDDSGAEGSDDDEDDDITHAAVKAPPPVPAFAGAWVQPTEAGLGGKGGRFAHAVISVPSFPPVVCDAGLFVVDQLSIFDKASGVAHEAARDAARAVRDRATTLADPRAAAQAAVAEAGAGLLAEPADTHDAVVGVHARTTVTSFAGVRKVLEMGRNARVSSMRAAAKAEGRLVVTSAAGTPHAGDSLDARETPLFKWFQQLAELAEEPSDPAFQAAVSEEDAKLVEGTLQLAGLPGAVATEWMPGLPAAAADQLVSAWHFMTLFHVPLGLTAVSLPDFADAVRYRGGDAPLLPTFFMRMLYHWYRQAACVDTIAAAGAAAGKLRGKAAEAAMQEVPDAGTAFDDLSPELQAKALARVPVIHVGTWQEVLRGFLRQHVATVEERVQLVRDGDTVPLAKLTAGADASLAAAAVKCTVGAGHPAVDRDGHVMGMLPGSALGAAGADPALSFDVRQWGVGVPAPKAAMTAAVHTALTAGSKVKKKVHVDAEGTQGVQDPPGIVCTPAGEPLGPVMSACATILGCLMVHFRAKPFLHPVRKPDAPEYHDIIQHPMDLTTVQQRLFSGYYTSATVPPGAPPRGGVDEDGTPRPVGADPGTQQRGFLADMRLVWNNCITFNGEGTPIGRAAVDLGWLFQQEYMLHVQPLALELQAARMLATLSSDGARGGALATPGLDAAREREQQLPSLPDVLRDLGSAEFSTLPPATRTVALQRVIQALADTPLVQQHTAKLRKVRHALAKDVEALAKARAAAKRTLALARRLAHVWGSQCRSRYHTLQVPPTAVPDGSTEWAAAQAVPPVPDVHLGRVDLVNLARQVRTAKSWDSMASRYHTQHQHLTQSRVVFGRGSIPAAPTDVPEAEALRWLPCTAEGAKEVLATAAAPPPPVLSATIEAEEAAWRRRAASLLRDTRAAARCVAACTALLSVAWDKVTAVSTRPVPLLHDARGRGVWWMPTCGATAGTPMLSSELAAAVPAGEGAEDTLAANPTLTRQLVKAAGLAPTDGDDVGEEVVMTSSSGGSGALLVDTTDLALGGRGPPLMQMPLAAPLLRGPVRDTPFCPNHLAATLLQEVVAPTLTAQCGVRVARTLLLLRSAARLLPALKQVAGSAPDRADVDGVAALLAALPLQVAGGGGLPPLVTATHPLQPGSARALALLLSTWETPLASKADKAATKELRALKAAVPASTAGRLLAAMRDGTVWPDWGVAMATAGDADQLWHALGPGVEVEVCEETAGGDAVPPATYDVLDAEASAATSAFSGADPTLSVALLQRGAEAVPRDAFAMPPSTRRTFTAGPGSKPPALAEAEVDGAGLEAPTLAVNAGSPAALRAALHSVDLAGQGYSAPPPELGAFAHYANTLLSDLEGAKQARSLASAARLFLLSLAYGRSEEEALEAVRASVAAMAAPSGDDDDDDDSEEEDEEEEGGGGEGAEAAPAKTKPTKSAPKKPTSKKAAGRGATKGGGANTKWRSLADALASGYVCDARWTPTGDSLAEDAVSMYVPSVALLSEGFLSDVEEGKPLAVLPSATGVRQASAQVRWAASEQDAVWLTTAVEAAEDAAGSPDADGGEGGEGPPLPVLLSRRHALYAASASLEASPAAAVQYALLQLDIRLCSGKGLRTWAASRGRHIWRARVAAAAHIDPAQGQLVAAEVLASVSSLLQDLASVVRHEAGGALALSAAEAGALVDGAVPGAESRDLLAPLSPSPGTCHALNALALSRLSAATLAWEGVLVAEGGTRGIVHPAWPESRASWAAAVTGCRTFSQLGVLVERLTTWGVLWEVVEGGRQSLVGAVEVQEGEEEPHPRAKRQRTSVTYAEDEEGGGADSGSDGEGEEDAFSGSDA